MDTIKLTLKLICGVSDGAVSLTERSAHYATHALPERILALVQMYLRRIGADDDFFLAPEIQLVEGAVELTLVRRKLGANHAVDMSALTEFLAAEFRTEPRLPIAEAIAHSVGPIGTSSGRALAELLAANEVASVAKSLELAEVNENWNAEDHGRDVGEPDATSFLVSLILQDRVEIVESCQEVDLIALKPNRDAEYVVVVGDLATVELGSDGIFSDLVRSLKPKSATIRRLTSFRIEPDQELV